ncbi:DNA-processing protein DprA [Lederbergia citrea]|uniref:DNA-processing protein DprA n=1 Tax=Lederbergia citrea TaxID=2833581 RepID=A0A942UKX3_9BACI|nr:DNA-processing protein DprA [Lederbergia citrea]MBS4177135.1 DNA-processing protein DprA [Lederbergia citrea]MBS4221617.1 DNA-processing protein DprA [Lederbergia citrea]
MIKIFEEKLFHLIHCRHLTHRSIRKLLKVDPDLNMFPSLSLTNLQRILQLESTKINKFSEEYLSINVQKLFAFYESKNISMISFRDPSYPHLLKEIHDPPLVLFTMGDQTLLDRHSVAIVGARDANSYAEKALDLFLPSLIEKNIVIVSGLAKGADTMAHKRTIELSGKTIAVLGGGFFHLYPSENRGLAEKIIKEHLLISEYPPIWRPEKWYFPMRNRIISGLTKGTIVLQAKKKSGSLITADLALEAGREVFALPGQINDKLSEGTNQLIKQGAKLIASSDDILEELFLS